MVTSRHSTGNPGWHRVFGASDAAVSPESLLEQLRQADNEPPIACNFHSDEQGWFDVDVTWPLGDSLILHRYLATEEGIRAELNTWAAWLEANAPNPEQFMVHMIRTKQVFTFRSPPWCTAPLFFELCKFLAKQTDGIFQIDGQGFFTKDGNWIVQENP